MSINSKLEILKYSNLKKLQDLLPNDFWKDVSKMKLDPEFIEEYKDKIDWEVFSKFITKHYDDDLKMLVKKYYKYIVPQVFLSSLKGDKWNYVKKYINWKNKNILNMLPEKSIKFVEDVIDWDAFSKYYSLNINIINKYKNKMNWKLVSKYNKSIVPLLSNDLINPKLLDFKSLSYQKLDAGILENYGSKLDWDIVSRFGVKNAFNQPDSFLIENFKDSLNWDFVSFLNLNVENLKNYINWDVYSCRNLYSSAKLSFYNYINWYVHYTCYYYNNKFVDVDKVKQVVNNMKLWDKLKPYYSFWFKVKEHIDLPREFVERFKYNLNWNVVSKFYSLDDVRDDWKTVSMFYPLTLEFVEQYEDKLDWNIVSLYTNCYIKDMSLAEKFKDRLNWDFISMKLLPVEFLQKFKDYVNWYIIALKPCNSYLNKISPFSKYLQLVYKYLLAY